MSTNENQALFENLEVKIEEIIDRKLAQMLRNNLKWLWGVLIATIIASFSLGGYVYAYTNDIANIKKEQLAIRNDMIAEKAQRNNDYNSLEKQLLRQGIYLELMMKNAGILVPDELK